MPAEPVTRDRVVTLAEPSARYQTVLWTDLPLSQAEDVGEGLTRAAHATQAAHQAQGAGTGDQQAAPIVVSVDSGGRIVLSSRDSRALDMLEQLATRTAPPAKNYHVFRLKNAPAGWVVLNLEDFFEDEEETERQRTSRMSMIFGMSSSTASDNQRRLSNRKPLRFISDLDTNTILVQGADPQQLQTIADLIELYDVPEPVNSQNARTTKLFTIRYSKASIVADTIKDAYRDLLSSNDRALQNGAKNQQGKQSRDAGMTVISAFGFGGESPPPTDTRTSARFEGKLSIGIDDVSNTLLVSTEGEILMTVVGNMIQGAGRGCQASRRDAGVDGQPAGGRFPTAAGVGEGVGCRAEAECEHPIEPRGTGSAASVPGHFPRPQPETAWSCGSRRPLTERTGCCHSVRTGTPPALCLRA